jgi:hypothetical protein
MTTDTDPAQSPERREQLVVASGTRNIEALQEYQEKELAEVSRSQKSLRRSPCSWEVPPTTARLWELVQ